jgi:hypothetical protein
VVVESLLVSVPVPSRAASLPASGTPPSGGSRHVPMVQVEPAMGQSIALLHSRQVLVIVLQAGVGAAQSVLARHWTQVLLFKLHAGVGAVQSVFARHWTQLFW